MIPSPSSRSRPAPGAEAVRRSTTPELMDRLPRFERVLDAVDGRADAFIVERAGERVLRGRPRPATAGAARRPSTTRPLARREDRSGDRRCGLLVCAGQQLAPFLLGPRHLQPIARCLRRRLRQVGARLPPQHGEMHQRSAGPRRPGPPQPPRDPIVQLFRRRSWRATAADQLAASLSTGRASGGRLRPLPRRHGQTGSDQRSR
jgi:hypothetical protein